ncbi:VanW family protein [Meiothermus taiwanensis]|uniref:Vancomycin B-type resistance protein VanW n=3 Tax=Meiothermus taiwanensis TaxID=172827 RepID=A0A399E1K6_9DEIN|nr:VanW family protein [Meiothermus taiwanensis]AWR87315.1 VanW family protein [Meiothermus taiwanensis WR-220]RIH76111.1 Vancomycin B-type resistance protein VanW [Meiothermus taiwanensis]
MRRGVVVGLGLATGLALGWAAFEHYHRNRIYAGVEAAGVRVGSLTLEEAEARIAAATQNTPPPRLTLKAGDKTLEVSAAELGWRPDPRATALRAFAVGRTSLGERLAALRGQIKVPLVPGVDAAALEKRLQSIARGLEHPPTNARVVFQNDRYVVVPEKPGLALDVLSAIETYLQHPELTVLEFFPKPLTPRVTAAMLEPVARRANELLRPLDLIYTEPPPSGSGKRHRYSLGTAQVASLLSVQEEVRVNTQALRKLLAQIAARHDRLPKDARYSLGPEGQLTVQPEVNGWKMNQIESHKRLELALLRPDLAEFHLTVLPKAAQVRAADLPKAENLQLLAEATTHYAGSSPERIANVHAAARNLDGYVVPAGGVFNFNEAIGSISPENGFKEALVISEGRTVMGVGGGVCQVSTTAFRALYQAGLPILERNQHAYRVRWYDPIVGYDAAVYQPYLNLRAANDTPGPIVVRTSFTRSSLTVQLYGLPDGRKVTVSKPVILARTPHPPPQYIVDPSLRPGQIKQVDWAVDGFRTRITRTILWPDGRVSTDVLNSNFRPWRAVYLVGPQTPIPGDAVASRNP